MSETNHPLDVAALDQRGPAKISASVTEDTDRSVDQSIPNQEEEVSMQPELKINNSELATVEEEIQVFKGISMQQATPLYDAALSRALPQRQALLAQGAKAEENGGCWGTPVAGAVFDEGVKLLLHAGANSLSLAGPLNGPLQTAACFAIMCEILHLTHDICLG
ncbi:MAG: hypothetical protein M1821_003325 [Bathelium mastoideum]|nr:MAG: hypothetical protein M1821_003325 [Bathelium mastoideum]